jgi:hypothetical protein
MVKHRTRLASRLAWDRSLLLMLAVNRAYEQMSSLQDWNSDALDKGTSQSTERLGSRDKI